MNIDLIHEKIIYLLSSREDIKKENNNVLNQRLNYTMFYDGNAMLKIMVMKRQHLYVAS